MVVVCPDAGDRHKCGVIAALVMSLTGGRCGTVCGNTVADAQKCMAIVFN